MNTKTIIALTCLCIALFAQETSALKCYNCEFNCTLNRGLVEECKVEHEPRCVRMWQGTEVTHRGCYSKDFCGDNTGCSTCKTDLCNASNQLILPLFLINTLIFLLIKLLF